MEKRKIKALIKEALLSEKETLRTWFGRRGAPGKKGGWVDCNSPIRKNGKITGYKPCGRQKKEKKDQNIHPVDLPRQDVKIKAKANHGVKRNKMKKLLLISLLSLFFIGCGSYNYSSYYQIKDILAVTQDGDTIAVPIREFERQKYDTYTRFNYNNTWYWNNWRYDYPWRYNYWYINPRQYVPQVIITPSKKNNITRLPRVNDRPKPGVTSPLPPKPPRTKEGFRPTITRPNNSPNTRVRTTPNVIQRNNTTRGSSGGSRSSSKGKPID